MTDPTPHQSHAPERPAEVAQRRDPGAGQGAAGSGPSPDEARFANSETALGGADAVQKTSYVVGAGTEPSGHSNGTVNAQVPSGAGPNFLAWGVGAVALVIVLVYLFQMMA